MSDGIFFGLLTLAVVVFVGMFAWAFVTVVGIMESRLGLSWWEAVAILTLASFIFGSSGVSSRKS